jgi:uroporphyrin-III C-methyltransferase
MPVTDEVDKKPAAQEENAPVAHEGQTPAPEKPAPKKPVHHKPRKSGNSRSLWIFVLLLAIAGGGFYIFTVYQKQQNQFTTLINQQAQLRAQLEAQKDQLEQQVTRQLQAMQAMQAQQDELTTYIEVLRQRNQHLRKDWLVLEAEYLLQMANHRLLFERDVNTAVAALDAADTRLRETGDPAALGVRKAIAEAIQALKQVPQADLAGLSLTLSAINKELDTLPLKTPDPKSRQDELQREETGDAKVSSWSDLPAAIWRDLKSLVVIRDHREPVQPLISPDQRFFLIENLRLQIEQARLAMLSAQGDVYKERLATAIQWIEEHFNTDSAHTQGTLDTLHQLQSATVAPALPDISAAYKAMQQLRSGVPQEDKPATEQGNHS